MLSAHRTPDEMFRYAETAASRGLRCIIAGACGAAHLPACMPPRPRFRFCPCRAGTCRVGLTPVHRSDAQGVPVATFAIGEAGAANAGLFAVALLASSDATLTQKLADFRQSQEAAVKAMQLPPVK